MQPDKANGPEDIIVTETLGMAGQQERGCLARCPQVQDDVSEQLGGDNSLRCGQARFCCRYFEEGKCVDELLRHSWC